MTLLYCNYLKLLFFVEEIFFFCIFLLTYLTYTFIRRSFLSSLKGFLTAFYFPNHFIRIKILVAANDYKQLLIGALKNNCSA